MRQHSLVGPLLLIGIGVAFLARNVIPDFPLLDYMAKYWPFLLVLWGSMRLLELATWAMRGRPLPARGLHGGEWMLVIFLCFIGMGLHAVSGFRESPWLEGFRFGTWELFGESFDYPESLDTTVASANPRIVLDQFRGNVRIVGVEGTAVKLNGHRTIRSMDQASADRVSKDSELKLQSDGDQVAILQPRPNGNREEKQGGVTHDVDITVPKGSTVIFKGRNSHFDVRDVGGRVEVNAEYTTVRLENIGSDARVEVDHSDLVRVVNLRGDLELSGRGNDIDLENITGQVNAGGSWSGLVQMRALAKPVQWKGLYTTMTAQAVPGEIRTTTGDINAFNITGPLRIESTNKDIILTDVHGPTDISLTRGDIRIAATSIPLHDMRLRSEGGEVQIELPAQAKFNLNAVTERGDARNGFGGDVRYEESNRGGALRSTGGGATIDVHVTRGDISIRTSGPGGMTANFPARPQIPEIPELPKKLKQLPGVVSQ